MPDGQFQGFVVPVNQFIHDRVTSLVSFMGIYDQLNFSALPATGALRVGGRIWGGPGGTHRFKVEMIDLMGTACGGLEQEFTAPDSPAIQHTLGVELEVAVTTRGAHQVKLFVDHQLVATHPVIVQ